jgi:hypothetical protein
MAFAIVFNPTDLQVIADGVNTLTIGRAQDRTRLQSVWQGGFNGWQTAPLAPPQYQTNDGDNRIVAVATTVTKAQLIQTLYRVALDNLTGPGATTAEYVYALARDMEFGTSCIEPWPQ